MQKQEYIHTNKTNIKSMRLTEPWILQWTTLQCRKYICTVQLHFAFPQVVLRHSAICLEVEISKQCESIRDCPGGRRPSQGCLAPICPPWLHLCTNMLTLITFAGCHQYPHPDYICVPPIYPPWLHLLSATNMPPICHQYAHPDYICHVPQICPTI